MLTVIVSHTKSEFQDTFALTYAKINNQMFGFRNQSFIALSDTKTQLSVTKTVPKGTLVSEEDDYLVATHSQTEYNSLQENSSLNQLGIMVDYRIPIKNLAVEKVILNNQEIDPSTISTTFEFSYPME